MTAQPEHSQASPRPLKLQRRARAHVWHSSSVRTATCAAASRQVVPELDGASRQAVPELDGASRQAVPELDGAVRARGEEPGLRRVEDRVQHAQALRAHAVAAQDLDGHDERVGAEVVVHARVEHVQRAVVGCRRHERCGAVESHAAHALGVVAQRLEGLLAQLRVEPHGAVVEGAQDEVVAAGVDVHARDPLDAALQLGLQRLLLQVVDAHRVLVRHVQERLGGVEGRRLRESLVLGEGALARALGDLVDHDRARGGAWADGHGVVALGVPVQALDLVGVLDGQQDARGGRCGPRSQEQARCGGGERLVLHPLGGAERHALGGGGRGLVVAVADGARLGLRVAALLAARRALCHLPSIVHLHHLTALAARRAAVRAVSLAARYSAVLQPLAGACRRGAAALTLLVAALLAILLVGVAVGGVAVRRRSLGAARGGVARLALSVPAQRVERALRVPRRGGARVEQVQCLALRDRHERDRRVGAPRHLLRHLRQRPRAHAAPRRDVPQTDSLVVPAGHQPRARGVHADAAHAACVAAELNRHRGGEGAQLCSGGTQDARVAMGQRG